MAAVGFVNGWLIAFVEIPALLATLASAMLVTGFFRFAVLRGEYLLILPKSNPAILFFKSDILPGLHAPVALMIATLILTWLLLSFTTTGRIVYAMGDNFLAARLAGLPVRATTIFVYIYSALTALIAGLVIAAASGTVDFRSHERQSAVRSHPGGGARRHSAQRRTRRRGIFWSARADSGHAHGITLYDFSTQTQDMLRGVVLIAAIFFNYLNPRDAETDTVGDL